MASESASIDKAILEMDRCERRLNEAISKEVPDMVPHPSMTARWKTVSCQCAESKNHWNPLGIQRKRKKREEE
jgi:hypothetical protein